MTHSKSEIIAAASTFAVLIAVWCFYGFGLIKNRATRTSARRIITLVTLVVITLAAVGGWIVFKLSK